MRWPRRGGVCNDRPIGERYHAVSSKRPTHQAFGRRLMGAHVPRAPCAASCAANKAGGDAHNPTALTYHVVEPGARAQDSVSLRSRSSARPARDPHTLARNRKRFFTMFCELRSVDKRCRPADRQLGYQLTSLARETVSERTIWLARSRRPRLRDRRFGGARDLASAESFNRRSASSPA